MAYISNWLHPIKPVCTNRACALASTSTCVTPSLSQQTSCRATQMAYISTLLHPVTSVPIVHALAPPPVSRHTGVKQTPRQTVTHGIHLCLASSRHVRVSNSTCALASTSACVTPGTIGQTPCRATRLAYMSTLLHPSKPVCSNSACAFTGTSTCVTPSTAEALSFQTKTYYMSFNFCSTPPRQLVLKHMCSG